MHTHSEAMPMNRILNFDGGSTVTIISMTLGAIVTYITPIQPFLVAVVVLVFADVVTGVWASLKRGEEFRAARLVKTVRKCILYTMAILLAHLMVVTFFPEVIVLGSLTYMVALFISIVEFQSNMENIGDITGIDLWAKVRRWISDKVKSKENN